MNHLAQFTTLRTALSVALAGLLTAAAPAAFGDHRDDGRYVRPRATIFPPAPVPDLDAIPQRGISRNFHLVAHTDLGRAGADNNGNSPAWKDSCLYIGHRGDEAGMLVLDAQTLKVINELPRVMGSNTQAHRVANHEPAHIPKQGELPAERLTAAQIIDARRHFSVDVLAFDASKPYGSSLPYADYVKLRVTNHSDVMLPYLTLLTKRYSGGNAIGWSRAPALAVHDLKPKESRIVDYFPHGRISAFPVDKLTVEVEHAIDDEDARFFKELDPQRH